MTPDAPLEPVLTEGVDEQLGAPTTAVSVEDRPTALCQGLAAELTVGLADVDELRGAVVVAAVDLQKAVETGALSWGEESLAAEGGGDDGDAFAAPKEVAAFGGAETDELEAEETGAR